MKCQLYLCDAYIFEPMSLKNPKSSRIPNHTNVINKHVRFETPNFLHFVLQYKIVMLRIVIQCLVKASNGFLWVTRSKLVKLWVGEGLRRVYLEEKSAIYVCNLFRLTLGPNDSLDFRKWC